MQSPATETPDVPLSEKEQILKIDREIEDANRKLEEAERSEKRRRRAESLRIIFILYASLIVSFLLVYSQYKKVNLADFFLENQKAILATVIMFCAVGYVLARRSAGTSSFQDVDIKRRLGFGKKAAVPAAWPFPTGNSITQQEESVKKSFHTTFYRHFKSISDTLEEKALSAEEKASLLLDKGTTYTIAGIIFFIISIISWQTIAWIRGFHTEFIYGIASCSALFIFIEFLSGWFLRQYRHFIDTSTYLLKVKSIFDKFMLAYLAYDDLSDQFPEQKQESLSTLLGMLEKDFKWPETYLLKKAEVSFANEAMSAIHQMTRDLKKINKKNKQRGENSTGKKLDKNDQK